MEADVLNALKSRTAYLSGGVDLDSNLLLIFQLPSELQPWTRRYIELSIKYFTTSLRYVFFYITSLQKNQKKKKVNYK